MAGKVVMKTGANVRALGMLYKAVVQSVILYGSKSLVAKGEMLKLIEGFHNWVARSIMGMTVQHTTGGEWEWPLVVEALETSGIWPIKEYTQQRQATIAVQVACRPIYEICTGSERIPGTSKFM